MQSTVSFSDTFRPTAIVCVGVVWSSPEGWNIDWMRDYHMLRTSWNELICSHQIISDLVKFLGVNSRKKMFTVTVIPKYEIYQIFLLWSVKKWNSSLGWNFHSSLATLWDGTDHNVIYERKGRFSSWLEGNIGLHNRETLRSVGERFIGHFPLARNQNAPSYQDKPFAKH